MFGIFRFLLATNVVLYHISAVPYIGPYSVYSFFILSGFLMTTIMHNTYDYNAPGIKKYFTNRFLRLYPVYWFLLVVTLLIILAAGSDFTASLHASISMPTSLGEALQNLSLIYPAFYPVTVIPILAPSTWALTIEIFYYILIGFGLSKSRKITLTWLLLAVIYTIGSNIYHGNLGLTYGNILSASLPFALGASIYFYQEKIIQQLKKIPGYFNLLITLFAANFIIPVASSYLTPEQSWKFDLVSAYLNLPLSILVIIILLHKKSDIGKKFDRFFGDLSYPIYIFHLSAACFISWLIIEEAATQKTLEYFLWTFSVTILVSIIANTLVNKHIEVIRARIKQKANI